MTECPSGKLSKTHLQRLFKRVFPVGDSENFCDYIFRLFDDDGNNVLEFKEFLQVNFDTFLGFFLGFFGTFWDFLEYIFRLFDDDGNNVLEFKEFLQVNFDTFWGFFRTFWWFSVSRLEYNGA